MQQSRRGETHKHITHDRRSRLRGSRGLADFISGSGPAAAHVDTLGWRPLGRGLARRGRSGGSLLLLLLLLGHNLPRVEFDQHRPIRLQLLHRDGEAEIVQQQELELEVVELDEREAPDLFAS